MHLDLIQWNISYNCRADKISTFLKSQISSNCIVCLQEVLQTNMEQIVAELNPSDYKFSLHMRPPGHFEGKNRKLGLLTMTFGGNIINGSLLDRSVFPERTLLVETEISATKVKVLSFHSLTGVDYRRGKSSNFAAIAGFLYDNSLDFFCCDANEPKIDALDIENTAFWDNGDKGKYPAMIFGKDKVHDLQDSFRSVQNEFPELPVSHKTGQTYRRYDMIFHSSNWNVNKLEYLYEQSLNATSDHALILGKYSKINSA